MRYAYDSMTTPRSIVRARRRDEGAHAAQAAAGADATTRRSTRASTSTRPRSDGTQIPISVVYRKDTPRDGTAPLLVYGYGSYGVSIEPTFDATDVSLLDRGWVYAIAHVRGGEELGRAWYEDGKLMKKMNTFTDFIAVTEHLVAQQATARAIRCSRWAAAPAGC